MKVKVKYFASLKQHLGRSEEQMDLNNGMTVSELWQQISGDDQLPEKVMTAVNMEYVKSDTVLKQDDEVAFFPPVTGG